MDLDAAQFERGFALGGERDVAATDRDADVLAGLAPWADSATRLGARATLTLRVGHDPRRTSPVSARAATGQSGAGAPTRWGRIDAAMAAGLCVEALVDDGGAQRLVAVMSRPSVLSAVVRAATRLGWRVEVVDGASPWGDLLAPSWMTPLVVPRVFPTPTLPGEPVEDGS